MAKAKVYVSCDGYQKTRTFDEKYVVQMADGNWSYTVAKNVWHKSYGGDVFPTKEALLKHINNGYMLYTN
jgi:hypothetical protein